MEEYPQLRFSIACPECGSAQSRVLKFTSKGTYISRRRECLDCLFRYTTAEVHQTALDNLQENIISLVNTILQQFDSTKEVIVTKNLKIRPIKGV